MKQFIYAKRYVDTFHSSSAADNKPYDLGIVNTNMHDSAKQTTNIVLRDGKGLEKYYPIYSKNFTIVGGEHKEGTNYAASFTIPEVTPYSNYTVIFVKKGKQFNERSNWTCTVHATAKDTAETVAKKIEKYLTNNKATLGLIPEVSGATISVTGPATGESYEVTLADELIGETVTQTHGESEYLGIEMIKDLAAKCAADAGFEYTAEDALELYPGLEADFSDTTEFDLVTVRFTEPRLTGTREESVYQTIHIATPKGNGGTIYTQIERALMAL